MSIEAEREFERSNQAVREARLFVLATLFGWGRSSAVQMTQLVTSELVTNALQHTEGAIGVHLELDGDRLRVEVQDQFAERAPVLKRNPVNLLDGGRGLHIVDAVAQEWGWRPADTGKAVWAVLDIAQPW